MARARSAAYDHGMRRLTSAVEGRIARGAFVGVVLLWLVASACRDTADRADVIIEPVTATPPPAASPTVAVTPTAITTPAVAVTAAPTAAGTPTVTPTAPPTPTAIASPTPAPTATTTPATTATPEPIPAVTPTPDPTSTPAPAPVPTPTAGPPPTPTPPPVEPTATTGALAIEELPVIEFVRADGTSVVLRAEAPPRSEYSVGLSGRYELVERGMLFHYPDDSRARPFWMRNTHIDLDIAFVGADFVIIDIQRMTADTDDLHRPDRGYMYAVEAPAGWYESNAVAVGDVMWLRFELPAE